MTTTAPYPLARYVGPLPASNWSEAGIGLVVGMQVHHGDGSLASITGEFMRDGSEKSAHYGVDFDGSSVLYVNTAHVAYAGCLANWTGYVTLELASDPAQPDAPATQAQVHTVAAIARHHGIQPERVAYMGGPGVGGHREFPGECSRAWGLTDCPGDGIFDVSIPEIVANMGGNPPPHDYTGDVDVLYTCIENDHSVSYFRPAPTLVKMPPEEAQAYYPAIMAGQVAVIPLGPPLAVLAFNDRTVKALKQAGVIK